MADDDDIEFEITPAEKGLDVAALVAGFTPVVGSAISGVLSGMSQQRKLNRVAGILHELEQNLSGFKSEVMEDYVKTEDFEELLEQALRRGADERSAEMRALYRNFLTQAIKYPGDKYDEQLAILRVLEQLNSSHMQILSALEQPPSPGAQRKMMGSPRQTLQERTSLSDEELKNAVGRLNDLRITNLGSLMVMMTGAGAEDLRHNITPFGHNVLKYFRNQ